MKEKTDHQADTIEMIEPIEMMEEAKALTDLRIHVRILIIEIKWIGNKQEKFHKTDPSLILIRNLMIENMNEHSDK